MMKVLFFGTPKFSEIVLEKLIKAHQVVGVVCRAGKPSGRGNKIIEPHIVDMAKGLGIKVYQPENLKANIDVFKNIDCDIFVTASYGKIIPKEMLDLKMCINVHPSMLPKYRGANPIQRAIYDGKQETGITTMLTVLALDAGDICLQEKIKITSDMTDKELMNIISDKAPFIMYPTIKQLYNKILTPQQQDETKVTIAKKFKKEDAVIDWTKSAQEIHNQVRSMTTWPVAVTIIFCMLPTFFLAQRDFYRCSWKKNRTV